MRRLRQFVAVAGLASLETLRRPVSLLLMIGAVLGIGLVPLLLLHNFGEDGKLARDSAFAMHAVFGMAFAGYAAASAMARERRGAAAALVLAKPVSRDMVFLATYAGVAFNVLVFSWCATLATLLGERTADRFIHAGGRVGYSTDVQTGLMLLAAPAIVCLAAAVWNYRRRRAFTAALAAGLPLALLAVLLLAGCFNRGGYWAPYDLQVQWRLAAVSLLLTLALLVLAALALTVSVRTTAGPVLAFCAAAFLLGLMSDHLFGRMTASLMGQMAYAVIPNWQHFWMADAVNRGQHLPASYLFGALAYAAAYAGAWLAAGTAGFRRVDVLGLE